MLSDFQQHASQVLDVLKERVSYLPDEVIEIAATVLSRRRRILDHFAILKSASFRTQRIRIHGDYHLGQVLRVKTDFVILDFEGEPARPLAYRRAKQCPLKDVAGMLRSFSYAAYASLINYTDAPPRGCGPPRTLGATLGTICVRGISARLPGNSSGRCISAVRYREFRKLLDLFLLDKALYEVLYELNARPDWVRIPLLGIMSLSI